MVKFPAPEPATTEHIAQVVSLLLACAYGIDYLIQPPKASLYTVEELIGPLAPWGAMFVIFGTMGLIGELWLEIGRAKDRPRHAIPYICRAKNRWWPSFTAHVVLCGMYAGLAAGSIAEMVVNGHFYGARVVMLMLILTTWHAFFAQRRRHAP